MKGRFLSGLSFLERGNTVCIVRVTYCVFCNNSTITDRKKHYAYFV